MNVKSYNVADGKQDAKFERNEITGLPIEINLSDFLDKVVISPEAEDWFVSLVKSVLRRYRVEVPVEKSELSEEPTFDGVGIRVKEGVSSTPDQ